MAKTFSQLVSVMEILKEAIKLVGRNSKIFLIIAVFTMIPYSLIALANGYSLVSLTGDLSMSVLPLFSMEPTSTEYHKQVYRIQEDTVLLIMEQIIYLALITIILLSSTASTVYVCAMSYLGKDLMVNDLWLKLKKIWVRPLLTWFYIFLMIAGFFFSMLPLFAIVVVGKGSVVVVGVGSILAVLVTSLNIYFALIWMLSLVTSVLEDCYGLEALAKAENLVKGRKIAGFALTLFVFVLVNAVYLVSVFSKKPHRLVFQIFVQFFILSVAILVKILSMMVYTVFYFERKQSHGESLELEEEMGYKSVSTIPIDGSALP